MSNTHLERASVKQMLKKICLVWAEGSTPVDAKLRFSDSGTYFKHGGEKMVDNSPRLRHIFLASKSIKQKLKMVNARLC